VARPSFRPYLLLTRVSLAPSALVDAAVGLAIGGAGQSPGWRVIVTACVASGCVFAGGMALNDWADREQDRLTRPERAIPSGAVAPMRALKFAVCLLGIGVLLAFSLGLAPGLVLGAVATLAALYDLRLRGGWTGPAALALCRAGNLGFGVVAGLAASAQPMELAHWLPAIGYGLYVGAISRLSPFEDGHRPIEGNAPALPLRVAAITLACLPASAFALRPQPTGWGALCAFGISVSAAWGLWRLAAAQTDWTPGSVGKAMGMGLRRLMFATASLACMTWHGDGFAYGVTLAGLLGMALSHRLRQAFPPS